MSWLTRSELPRVLGRAAPATKRPAAATSATSAKSAIAAASEASGPGEWLVCAVPGEVGVPLSRDAAASLRTRSAAQLSAAGVASGQRALVSLASDGDLAGARIGDALVEVGASVAVVGARGRMRTLAAMRALNPSVWVTTPTGALDFLARLYLEFNVDPLELELDLILLVGEIPSAGSERRLADEFEARVATLFCDAVVGGIWGHGRAGRFALEDSDALGLAALERDDWLGRAAAGGARGGDGSTTSSAPSPREIVLRPDWAGPLAGATVRTGQVFVAGSNGTFASGPDAAFFSHTVGDHVLVRGRWLSLPLVRQALSRIDGIGGHRVEVARGEGTLDKLTIRLSYERPSLVENPMWAGRVREAIAALTPVEFGLEAELAGEAVVREAIVDHRGHHLGVDRAEVAARGIGGGDG